MSLPNIIPHNLSIPSPILKLNRDLLYKIFSTSAPWETPRYSSDEIQHYPLNITRRTSQVCRAWRDILLDSPSVWGRCIHLDVLNQANDHWRNLVLQRSGRSMLSVTGRDRLISGDGLSTFLVNLIEENFYRVARFKVRMCLAILDTVLVWRALGRPAENLKFFVLDIEDWDGPSRNLLADYQLFGNHAPSLSHLHLPREFRFPLNLKAPTLFNANMRSLRLLDPCQLSDVDLLTACMHMPSLETLKLDISLLILSKPSDVASLRPSMPNLNTIDIRGKTLNVYPGFLDRIIPSEGCVLHTGHIFNSWDELPSETRSKDLEHMQRVIQRFAVSFFKHHEGEENFFSDAILIIDPWMFNFTSTSHFQVMALFTRGLPLDLLLSLLDTISNLKFPDSLKELDLSISYRPDHINLVGIPSMLDLFKSMPHITVLNTSLMAISYLGQIAGEVNFFPCLESVFVISGLGLFDSSDTQHHYNWMMSFLIHRHSTTPVQILDLGDAGWPLGDLRPLNALAGLTVKWESEDGATRYICGTGDGEQLLLLDVAKWPWCKIGCPLF